VSSLLTPFQLYIADETRGLAAPPFHEWISNLTPKPFELHKPFNPVPFIVIPLVLVTLAGLTYALWPYALPLIQSRLVWGVASILLILTFTSGHMWNRIKNAPYVAVSQNGQTSWIAGGFQQQLGLESQVVGAICECISSDSIVLSRAERVRWSVELLHHRVDGVRPRSVEPCQTADRSVPLVGDARRRFQPLVQVVQSQERRVPVLALVLEETTYNAYRITVSYHHQPCKTTLARSAPTPRGNLVLTFDEDLHLLLLTSRRHACHYFATYRLGVSNSVWCNPYL
jgi:hypothetical protein